MDFDTFDWYRPRRRYVVTIYGSPKESWEYDVSTRYGEPKAVAIAVEAHVAHFGGRNEPWFVDVADEGESQRGDLLGDPRED